MIRTLFILTLLWSTLFYENTVLFGQSFTITPGIEIKTKGTDKEEQVIAEGKFINISKEKKTFQWYRIKGEMPPEWVVTTCVPGKCYSAEKDSGIFVLEAGKSGILDQNFFPNEISGKGEVSFFVYEKNKKHEAIKITYIAEVKNTRSVIDKERKK